MKQRALAATAWSGIDTVLRQGLQFAITVVLARLVAPSDFGAIALLSLFTGLATVLADAGLTTALIQRRDITHREESTAFWFNVAVGAAVATVFYATAPWLAALYELPVLVPLIGCTAVNLVCAAAGLVPATLLSKRLDFRTQLKAGVLATLLSAAVAVALARAGYGVWALVAQTSVMSIGTTVLLFACGGWRPALTFDRAALRRLFGFGSYVLAANLLDTLCSRVHTLLIGKLHGVRELGFYNRAETTQQLPANALAAMVGRVALPLLATTTDPAQQRRVMQVAIRGLTLVSAPTMLGLAAVAEPFVLTLFGPTWLEVVPLLRALCIAAVLWPMHVANVNLLMAQGQSRTLFRLELVKKPVALGLLVVGAQFGTLGIAWSQVAFSVFAFLINTRCTARSLGYGLRAQVVDLAPALALALPMALAVHMAEIVWDAEPALELLGLVGLGVVLYLLLAWSTRATTLRDVAELLPWFLRRTKAGPT